jgi:hypothetical protein
MQEKNCNLNKPVASMIELILTAIMETQLHSSI